MKIADATLKSVSPYSQNRHYRVDKKPGENEPDFEARTWQERCHVVNEKDNHIVIPAMQFANSLKEAARYLSLPIPGKQRQTFTKHFEAGVMVTENLVLPITKDEVSRIDLFVPSDGKRGGGRRVDKSFPIIYEWDGKITYWILDDVITEEAFTKVLVTSGQLIGIGRFRPRNLGTYGRFKVVNVRWTENATI